MTYFGFIVRVLIAPLIALALLTLWDLRRGKVLPETLRSWPAWAVLMAHVMVAVLYTTPWDNYLVATQVWYYDPALVAGITLGWVPLEEYVFFVLQTMATGLWLLYLARRLPMDAAAYRFHRWLRWASALIVGSLWLSAVIVFLVGWQPATYLALELAWALPPIMLQLIFGADILWRYRRPVLLALLSSTLYLCVADAMAVRAGTWGINPARSLNIYLGGYLPVEEFIFFLLTNMLIVFGIILVLARETRDRAASGVRARMPGRPVGRASYPR